MRMGAALLTADTPQVQIQTLLTLTGPGPLHAWLEDPLAPDGMRLRDDLLLTQVQIRHDGVLIAEPTTAPVGPVVWRHWPQGRLFSPEADLRWEQMTPAQVHVVVITAAPLGAPWDTEAILELEPVHPDDEYLLLWGRLEHGIWQEGRIPSLQRMYPPHWSGPYAALVTRTYEADWPEASSVRTVTRYIRYDGNYRPRLDPRFT
jgi:hypothetical protein